MGTREVFFFSPLLFLFVSFLSFYPFSFFFSLFFLVWERGAEGEMAIEIFVISFLLLFLFWKRNGKKNGSFSSFYLPSIFLFRRSKTFFSSSFSFSFVSFLLLFLLFFDFGGENGRGVENENFLLFFLFNSLFWKRNRGATGNFEGSSASFSS